MLTINALKVTDGEVPSHSWKRALIDAVWDTKPKLSLAEGVTWVTIANALLERHGEAALEALYTLGGEKALDRVAKECWGEPRWSRSGGAR